MERKVIERIVGLEKLYLKAKAVKLGKEKPYYGNVGVTLNGKTLEKLRKLKKHNKRCTGISSRACRAFGCDTYDEIIQKLVEGGGDV